MRASCPAAITADPKRLIGQMLIVRMEDVATAKLRRAARRGEIGGVILFPSRSVRPPALADQIRGLRRAAAAGDAPPPLVMIDQEGGEVKRLPEAPPSLGPAELAGQGEAVAMREGEATGRALAAVGIDVDLAPVLDLRSSPDSFIASRTLGDEAAEVARLGTGFGRGLQREGVAATAKHFPGLGLATVNTDLSPSVVSAARAELSEGLEPFQSAVSARFRLVMVSNATYPAYDAARPASQSPRLIRGVLRRELGFARVVITDDLGAGALTGAGLGEGEAAVGAARAGADLLLFAVSDGAEARTALLRALRRGELDHGALVASCARTTALRERVAA